MMECRDKFMLSMYISYFFWIGHAYGHCRNLDSESIFADVESKGSSTLHLAISTVFETFVSIHSRCKVSVTTIVISLNPVFMCC